MLLELEKFVFNAAENADLSQGAAPKDIYDQCIHELKMSFPAVNIAPYDELVFGTAFAVHLCRSLATKGILLTPDHAANTLLKELKQNLQGEIEVFLGEKTFVNFRLSQKTRTDYCKQLLSQGAETYLKAIFHRLDHCLNKKLQISLAQEFQTEINLRKDIDYHALILSCNQEQKNSFFLNYIADEEAEETVLEREADFNQMVGLIAAGYPTGTKLFSQSPHTGASSLKRIAELNLKIEHLILIFPFLLLDTLKQGRVKIFYTEYMEVRRHLTAIWTDKLIREQLLNSKVFNRGEICLLREAILWLSNLDEIVRQKFGI